jgi:hypothetical protein
MFETYYKDKVFFGKKKKAEHFAILGLTLYGVKFFTDKSAFLVNYKICGGDESPVL